MVTAPIEVPLLRKLAEMAGHYEQMQQQLSDPATLGNVQQLVKITKESGQLQPVVARYNEYLKSRAEVEELREMAAGKGDREMAELAEAELPAAEAKATEQLESLKDEFLAAEDGAVESFFLELRAGTGGEEAALFTRDLYEMYRRYCETHGWRFDVSDFSVSERGGFKECIVNIKGSAAYRHLRFEGGRSSSAARAGDRSPGSHSYFGSDSGGPAGNAGCENRDQSQRH